MDNTIIVDSSEPQKIKDMFIKLGIKHIVQRCPIGDFVCGDICIERKTMPDFVGSMQGHLQKQLMQMEENYKRPYLIISGSLKDLYAQGQVIAKTRGFNPYKKWTVNHHIGSLASIGIRYNVKILQVDSDIQLVKLVNKLIEKGYDGKITSIYDTELVLQRDKMTIDDVKYMMLRCIPKIGNDRAKILSKHIKVKLRRKTGEKLTEDFLTGLAGFGPILIKNILKINKKKVIDNAIT